jgi:hypothetical protein
MGHICTSSTYCSPVSLISLLLLTSDSYFEICFVNQSIILCYESSNAISNGSAGNSSPFVLIAVATYL